MSKVPKAPPSRRAPMLPQQRQLQHRQPVPRVAPVVKKVGRKEDRVRRKRGKRGTEPTEMTVDRAQARARRTKESGGHKRRCLQSEHGTPRRNCGCVRCLPDALGETCRRRCATCKP